MVSPDATRPKASFDRETAVQIAVMLLRVVAGLLFLQAGGSKLFDWFGLMPKTVPLLSQIGLAGVLEVVGGVLVMLGFGTRIVSFVLSGEMAVAYFQSHQPKGTWPIQNHGQQAVLFCFIFLFFAAYGAGRLSLDSILKKRMDLARGQD